MPESAGNASGFIESRMWIRSAAIRNKQSGYRVPRVPFEIAWCTMVTGYDGYGRIQFRDTWEDCIQLLNAFYFLGKVAVFACAVGVLEVDKEEIVLRPNLL